MRSSGTGSAATDSRRGLELDMESLSTKLPVPMAGPTASKIASGDAAERTDATRSAIIPGRSLPLSAADEQRLYRIRQDLEKGFMASVCDVEFLLEVIERCYGNS